MSRYSSLPQIGIKVVYLPCRIDLCVSNKLVSELGVFMVAEQCLEQCGSSRVYRLKLPYDCIIEVE
jgi:hypothetical protein